MSDWVSVGELGFFATTTAGFLKQENTLGMVALLTHFAPKTFGISWAGKLLARQAWNVIKKASLSMEIVPLG